MELAAKVLAAIQAHPALFRERAKYQAPQCPRALVQDDDFGRRFSSNSSRFLSGSASFNGST